MLAGRIRNLARTVQVHQAILLCSLLLAISCVTSSQLKPLIQYLNFIACGLEEVEWL